MGRLRRRPSEATVVNIAIRAFLMNLRSFRTSFSIGASGASAFFAILSPPCAREQPVPRACGVPVISLRAPALAVNATGRRRPAARPGSCIPSPWGLRGMPSAVSMTDTGVVEKLTKAQRDSLRDRGYVVLPGVVPKARQDAALRAINASLGRGLRAGGRLPVPRAIVLPGAPDDRRHPRSLPEHRRLAGGRVPGRQRRARARHHRTDRAVLPQRRRPQDAASTSRWDVHAGQRRARGVRAELHHARRHRAQRRDDP